jgi:hypothetical protein
MVFQEYCRASIFAGNSRGDGVAIVCSVIRKSIVVATILGLLAIIGTRLHYTLDVLIGTYITVLLWETYHYHMKSNEQGKKFDWALKILRWLEAEEVAAIDAAAWTRWANRGVLKQFRSYLPASNSLQTKS